MQRINWLMLGLLVLLLVVLSPSSGAQAQERPFPRIIELPAGFQPEGIVTGRGPTLYAGSLATGAIYQADLRTGHGSLLVPAQAGRTAVGLGFDPRSNYLFVAGGRTGSAYVYDAAQGTPLAVYHLSTAAPTFVNDVVVTREAAFFTDSSQPVLYRVPLDETTGRLPAPAAVETIPLGGDFEFVPGGPNANGIEAVQNGRTLIVVNTTTGRLYRVNARNGAARQIALGEANLTWGDGLLVSGGRLYVVQNRLNQIAVVRLTPDLEVGTVTRIITDPTFDVPTTIARFGEYVYVVNARFGTPPTPETTYTIVRVPAGR